MEYEKIEYSNHELKGSVNKLKIEIDEIKQKLDNIIENIEIYYKINENLYNNKYREYKNYEALMNINQLNKFNKIIKEDIDKIINEKNINKKLENLMNIYGKINSNYISGTIKINKKDINKDIRILNSFEEYKRKNQKKDEEDDYKHKNEEEIKSSIIIKIDGKIIDFDYFHEFEKEGEYKIEYIFNKRITNAGLMFCECKNLISLDLTNFNTEELNNMNALFYDCKMIEDNRRY